MFHVEQNIPLIILSVSFSWEYLNNLVLFKQAYSVSSKSQKEILVFTLL